MAAECTPLSSPLTDSRRQYLSQRINTFRVVVPRTALTHHITVLLTKKKQGGDIAAKVLAIELGWVLGVPDRELHHRKQRIRGVRLFNLFNHGT